MKYPYAKYYNQIEDDLSELISDKSLFQLIVGITYKICCFISFSFIVYNGYSQSPVYKTYTVKDGLPSQVVYCAIQDAEGYMWFGTDAGVSRFDGTHFHNYTIKDGLSDNEILNMFQDSKGRIWFYTLNGKVSYFFNQQFFNATNDAMLSKISGKYEFMSFLEDSKGNVWLGGVGSQLVLIENNGTVRSFDFDTTDIGFRRAWLYPYELAADEIWFITPYNILQYKNGKMSIRDNSNFLNPLKIKFHLYKFNRDRSYYFSKDGIYQLEKGIPRMLIQKREIPDYDDIRAIFVDLQERIWIHTSQFKTYSFVKEFEGYRYENTFFKGVEIGQLFIDNEMNKWFCSTGSGIFVEMSTTPSLVNPAIQFFPNTEDAHCIALDRLGNVWMGRSRGILNCVRDNNLLTFEFPDLNKITSIKFDDDNNLWCVVSNGVRFAKKEELKKQNIRLEFVYLEPLPGKFGEFYGAKQLAIDHHQKVFVSMSSGLTRLMNDRDKKYLTYWSPDNVFTKRIYCMYFDYQNNLWFENFEQLFCLKDNGVLLSFPHLKQEFLSQINDIESVSDSTLVIATYGSGISFFKDGKIINHVKMADGLAGDLCRKIFVDSTTIYVATNQGFSYFNYKNNQIADIKTITTSDGILSNDIKDICARGDNIYLATSSGLCIVNKNISQASAIPPPVYITSVFSKDSMIQTFQGLSFPYRADFTLNYIAVTFEQPDKISYQYNITGSEKNWIETKNTSIAFSSLSPGDYTFRLRAKKYNSDWSKPTFIQFSIIPPFWQQWWFRILFFCVFAATTYYLLKYAAERRYRIQLRLLKEKQVLADERSRISSDMHDDLGADLSNLLLMTRMTGQTSSLVDAEKNQLNKLEVFATGLVEKVDEIIWALNPQNDTLSGMIQFIHDYARNVAQLSFIEINIVIPGQIAHHTVSSVFRRNIFLVVKEALNNIVKHSKATNIQMEIALHVQKLEIRINDNGRGYDLKTLQPDGNGLTNMRKRIEELNGTFNIQSGPGKGSNILINVQLTE